MSNEGQISTDAVDDKQLYDLQSPELIDHRFDKIVGNQLLCSLHPGGICPAIFVKPTEVLEEGADGKLHLIDKAEQ